MESSIVVEGHTRAATVYLSGVLDAELSLRAEAIAVALPPEMAVLRFDLRGIIRVEAGAFGAIVRAVVHWRLRRRAQSHVAFPPRAIAGELELAPPVARCLLRVEPRDSCGNLGV